MAKTKTVDIRTIERALGFAADHKTLWDDVNVCKSYQSYAGAEHCFGVVGPDNFGPMFILALAEISGKNGVDDDEDDDDRGPTDLAWELADVMHTGTLGQATIFYFPGYTTS